MIYCANGSCVQITVHPDRVDVTDSKLGDRSPVITYSHTGWQALCDTIRAGGIPGRIAATGTGDVTWYGASWDSPIALEFTRDEWDTFVEGVRNGDFDIAPTAA